MNNFFPQVLLTTLDFIKCQLSTLLYLHIIKHSTNSDFIFFTQHRFQLQLKPRYIYLTNTFNARFQFLRYF